MLVATDRYIAAASRRIYPCLTRTKTVRERTWLCLACGRRLDAAMATEVMRRSHVQQMYVHPPRLLGRTTTSEDPFGHDGSDEYLSPKTNPEGDEAAFGFSDGTEICRRRKPKHLAGRTCRNRGRTINSCVFFPRNR